jgi:superfamily II DNA or RNA helicase
MSHKYRDKYIDLKINGRLFPSWVVSNFKEYKLDEIALGDEDPCTIKDTKKELKKYQTFVSRYLDFNSPYKNLLIYHGLGSGKTRSAINIYNVLYNYSPGWNVFILLPATLKPNWESELNEYLETEDKDSRKKNIRFISYNASNADKQFMDAIQKSDTVRKNMFIIDEAHNFIRNVHSNISSKHGKRAQTIYDFIIQDQQENQDTRVILLSATPAINTPFELGLLFNLLRPNIFTKSETQFTQEFISSTTFRSINPIKKNLFQRRIMGLVSYYIGATPDVFATKKTEYIYVKMDKYQEGVYDYFESIEEKIAKKNKSRTSSSETYKSYTRQACNFVFPFLGQGMTGETRPRPKNFKVSEKVGQELQKGKLAKDKDKEKYYDAKDYIGAITKFVKLFDNFLNDANLEDEKKNHTINDDIKIFKMKYKNNFNDFNENEKNKSSLYDELHKCSAKMLNMIFIMMTSPGPILVYSNYVLMEGIEIFKKYLKYFGFSEIDKTDPSSSGKDHFRYCEYHGMVSQDRRQELVEIFKSEANKYGKICKIILVSPAGAEGLNLFSIRQVHIMEPYWHEVRINQMVGRAIRLCGHKYLPREERHVDIYRYKSVRKDYPKAKWTTDQYIEDMARSKEGLIQSFLDCIKEVSIDCNINRNHNTLTQDYKCFQFEENSLFDEQIGPAYKDDHHDDVKIDNGSNAINSKLLRIKVMKIKAVRQLDKDGTKFSESEYYWYYSESGVIYDLDLHYAIGKIAYDDNKIPKKIDKETYIIDKLIPIPLLKDNN